MDPLYYGNIVVFNAKAWFLGSITSSENGLKWIYLNLHAYFSAEYWNISKNMGVIGVVIIYDNNNGIF